MHLRPHPQLQVVEPPDLIYFRFVIIIVSVVFLFFFVCFFALVCCLCCYTCFCFVHFTFNQLFLKTVVFEDSSLFTASHSLKRQFAILRICETFITSNFPKLKGSARAKTKCFKWLSYILQLTNPIIFFSVLE